MKIREELTQRLYDAINIDLTDLIEQDTFKSTKDMRFHRVRDLLNNLRKECEIHNPEFKLVNRLHKRDNTNQEETG